MYRSLTFIVTWCFITGFTPCFAATDAPTYTIEVAKISGSTVTSKDGGKEFTIADPKSSSLIEQIKPGDKIDAVLADDNHSIKELKYLSKPCSSWTRVLALGLGFSIIIGFFLLVSKGSVNKFIIGTDNRYSNSKVQVVLWFSALMTVYLATLGLRVSILGWDYFNGIGITENLLAMSGISALTYGAAKAVTVQKAEAAPSAKQNPLGSQDICSDLFQNDSGDFDLGDTQMFFFTLLAVAIFIITSFHFLGWLTYAQQITLPDVDTTLLSSLGLSQGAYLAKKAASKAGQG